MSIEKLFGTFAEARDFAKALAKQDIKHTIKSSPPHFVVSYDGEERETPTNVPLTRTELEQIMRDMIKDSFRFSLSQEDCNYYIGEIRSLLEDIKEDNELFAESLRAILELKEKLKKLPPQESVDELKELRRKEETLRRNAPICRKHGVPMILQRGGKYGYFWGCKNFALQNNDLNKCYITKQLTKEEKLIID